MTKLAERLIPPEILAHLRRSRGNREIWLVGGALRDHFLGRPHPDLDFVVDREAANLARSVADELNADFFVLDGERDAARVILAGEVRTLDFVRRRGPSIEADLQDRDFTINSLALALDDADRLIDPLRGLQDLKDRRLRACGGKSLERDPVRALRAVRLTSELGLRMESGTVRQVRQAGKELSSSPGERVRDEFMRSLDPLNAGKAIRLMNHLGLLSIVCPELTEILGPEEAGWQRALSTLDRLGELVSLLGQRFDGGRAENLALGELSLLLGRYRPQIGEKLTSPVGGGRQSGQLLALAALYCTEVRGSSAARESAAAHSAELAYRRCQELRLSRPEADRVRRIVRNHWRPEALAAGGRPGDGDTYRFFRDTGEAGVELILLFLAGYLAGLTPPPPPEEWRAKVGVARTLMEAWFDRTDQVIRPPKLLGGDELAAALGLQPGPIIGDLLEQIREAQAEGAVRSKEAALEFARRQLVLGEGPDLSDRPT